jgi:two-component system, NarL family, nitrate/nitrite response regulator NarL
VPTPIRILLVDDHTLFRDSVARLLAAEPDFVVAGDCAAAEEALRLLARTPVDVLLLDLDLGRESGADLLRQARAAGFEGQVLIVTAGLSVREASDLVRGGVAGVLLKHAPSSSLCQSIRDVAAGRVCFDQELLSRAVRGISGDPTPSPSRPLTERERHVISLVLDGLSNKEIADRLGASESSIKGILQQLFTKTGVRTRSQLVRIALERYRDALQP